MKSDATIRRWLKELKATPKHPNMELYAQGAEMALSCILHEDWPAPKNFVSIGNKVVVRQGSKAKLITRSHKEGQK